MTFPVNIKHGAKNRCWTFDKRKQFIECHIKWLERNSIFISERLSNISHLWNCVSPHNTFSTQVNLQKMNSNNIKGLINAYLAVAQHRAGGDVAFHSVKCCMCTHGSCTGSWNTQEVRMTDGSVPPLCQAGFNPTALWLRSSVSHDEERWGRSALWQKGAMWNRHLPACVVCMRERLLS